MLDAYHAMLGRKSITLMTHHNRLRFIFNIYTITMHFGALSGYLRLQGSSFATTKMYGYGVNLGALYRLMNITVKTFPILTKTAQNLSTSFECQTSISFSQTQPHFFNSVQFK